MVQYGVKKDEGKQHGISDDDVVFDTSRAREVSESMRDLPSIGLDLVEKCLGYWRSRGCL